MDSVESNGNDFSHQQQQNSSNNSSSITTSVIAHAPASTVAAATLQQQQQQNILNTSASTTTLGGNANNSHNGVEHRSAGYSINGILGIHHSADPNGNCIKRKRIDDHGKFSSLNINWRNMVTKFLNL